MTEQYLDRQSQPAVPALTWAAQRLHDLDDAGSAGSVDDALDRAARVVLTAVSGADAVSIVRQRGPGRYETSAATDRRAVEADGIQFELGHGPTVAAMADVEARSHHIDLARNLQHREYGRLLAARTGFASMLTFRLAIDAAQHPHVGCLNIYTARASGFVPDAVVLGGVLADRVAVAAVATEARDTIAGLMHARDSNRTIGVAVGVVMARHKVTRDQAFDLLRDASQNTNRKLHDIALDVVDTGELQPPPAR